MGKSTISMAIFNSYFDITRGYLPHQPSIMLRGMPAKPLTGSSGFEAVTATFFTKTRGARRPLSSAERAGPQMR